MSKTKNYFWDEAEKALDVHEAKKDAGESILALLNLLRPQNVAWDLVGFDTCGPSELENLIEEWFEEA